MIKDNQKILNRLHVLLDGLIIVGAYSLAFYLRFYSILSHTLFETPKKYFLPLSMCAQALIYVVPGYLLLNYMFNLYTPKRVKSRLRELWGLLQSNTVGIVLFILVLYLVKQEHFSRSMLATFAVLNVLLSFIFRLLIHKLLKLTRKHGYNLKHILVVGYSRSSETYIDKIRHNPQWGYFIHGILDDNIPNGTQYKGIAVTGTIEELAKVLSENKLDEIAIALSVNEYSKLEGIVSICEKFGVHTKFIPDYYSFIPTKPYTEDLDGLPVIHIRNVPLSNSFNMFFKRAVDIIGASIALLIFGIPMIIVSLIIKFTSPGPIIFSQVRVGLHNRDFKMYKFRSMEVQSDNKEKKAWTTMNDPRVTNIGKIIRKTSIDELPQLINVLKGDMSLVGPRPERPFFVEKFKEEIPRYMIKHQVRPGITGWAQINGYRGDTSIRKRIDHDLYYIENWNMELDIKILFLTIFKGFVNKNAY